MNLNEVIYKRKSTRSYTGEPVDEATIQKIEAFSAGLKPLYPDIKVRSEIVSKDRVKCILPWITPQLVAIYSEDKDGAFENAGFMFQQLDLYLQSLGLGSCWLGMGKINQTVNPTVDHGFKFIILLAFGYPKSRALRENVAEFKRQNLSEITDQPDDRLEPAQLAPSSVNSQPWYFTHERDIIHAYCSKRGFFKAKTLGNMNRIDMGITLAHMYIANPETFEFFKADSAKPIKDCEYIGSFRI